VDNPTTQDERGPLADLPSKLRDSAGLLAAFDQAGREAMWRHKRLGVPVSLWEDGRVVEIAAEDIPEEWCSRPTRLAFPW
jgi:hypothetical protein